MLETRASHPQHSRGFGQQPGEPAALNVDQGFIAPEQAVHETAESRRESKVSVKLANWPNKEKRRRAPLTRPKTPSAEVWYHGWSKCGPSMTKAASRAKRRRKREQRGGRGERNMTTTDITEEETLGAGSVAPSDTEVSRMTTDCL